MSQLITVREHVTTIPTALLAQGGFRPGDQAVIELVADGVLIRPLTAAEAIARPGRSATKWLPPLASGTALRALAA